MNDRSRTYYELVFRAAYLERRAQAFQDLFSDIMEARHPSDFQRVRPWGATGDQKNDGYLRSTRTLFQVYAPDEMRAAKTVRKIQKDFTRAVQHWSKYFERWIFVHNAHAGLGPDVLRTLLELGVAHPTVVIEQWGYRELLERVMELGEVGIISIFGPLPEHAFPSDERPKRTKKSDRLPDDIRAVRNRGIDLLNGGHFGRARIEFHRALALAEATNHKFAIVDGRVNVATVIIHEGGEISEALALLRSCMDLLAGTVDEQLVDVLSRFADAYEHQGDSEMSEGLRRQAIEVAAQLGDKETQGGLLVQLAWTVGRQGRTQQALELNEQAHVLVVQALHEHKESGTSDNAVDYIHTILGNLHFQRAKIHQRGAAPEEAERSLRTAIEWQRRVAPNHELAKLLRELAELMFFKRQWNEGRTLLVEAIAILEERQLLPQLAGCLSLVGRAHAHHGQLDEAETFFSEALKAATAGRASQEAADALKSLAHIALERQDSEGARERFRQAQATSDDIKFQAECLMAQRRLAEKDGDAEEASRCLSYATELLIEDNVAPRPEHERAGRYFELAYYLREADRAEEALTYVRRALDLFRAAKDAYGEAKCLFEMAGLLDRLGRKREARESCNAIRERFDGKPFFEIFAAVNLSLAKFALHDDKEVREAIRLVDAAIELCKAHRLPMLREALLFRDELEVADRAGTGRMETLDGLVLDLRNQIELAPNFKDAFLRFWLFTRSQQIVGALRATAGVNTAVFARNLQDFEGASRLMKPFREWSILVTHESYPESIRDTVPIMPETLIPANGVAMLGVKKSNDGAMGAQSEEGTVVDSPRRAGYDVAAEISIAGLARGGTLARYFIMSIDRKEFGSDLGFLGDSLAVPRVVHQLLQDGDVDVLRCERLFFVYYNRSGLDEKKWGWYDLAVLRDQGCIPVYHGSLPHSRDVRIVASSTIYLPALDDASAALFRQPVRSVRRALLGLRGASRETAAALLADLEEHVENLVSAIDSAETTKVVVSLLEFTLDGTATIHPAMVLL